ncbi:hypothetical protein M406DRAFT_255442 [Cryphonectria parasitica EP155]|uniref:Uncharacterized protein n=1 Tax=Cryphonectria parasitica (strain ATCC 38755 / EP155) TaxID=660469 RepID=A0A9P4Y2P5_CRYP1|nr:uncharacterized protein M406DRAFT_255442 [Cryphonectria parasitica EP155]KAF3765877.1 hypothetical protein M406DRAFT_255442 [Cryphonectria parasitica EP155]
MASSTTTTGSTLPDSFFHWQETRPGVWERHLDECEKFYVLTARAGSGTSSSPSSTCFPITGCAVFTTTTDAQDQDRVLTALRKAWTSLRMQHPTLGSRIVHDDHSNEWKRVYHSAWHEGSDLEKWLHSTFKVIDTVIDPLGWLNNETPPFEVPTIFVVRSVQQQSVVFLCCPHDLTDGVGILQLINQLFQYAGVIYGQQGGVHGLPDYVSGASEPWRLSPCLRIAAAIPDSLPETMLKRFDEIQRDNRKIYSHPGILGLPGCSAAGDAIQERNVQRVSAPLSKAVTEQLLRNCKKVAPGLSVTHVVMAAVAKALADLQPYREEPYTVRFVNQSMINLRPYCSRPYNSPDHSAAAYHTVSAQALYIDLVVPSKSAEVSSMENKRDDELHRIAIQVRDFYTAVRPRPDASKNTDVHEQVAMAPMVFKTFTPKEEASSSSSSSSSQPSGARVRPAFCPVTLSSIGNVDSMVSGTHGPFELTNVWAASIPPPAGLAIFLSTWSGKAELAGVFDTQFHEPAYIENFLGRVWSCALTGLEVWQQ